MAITETARSGASVASFGECYFAIKLAGAASFVDVSEFVVSHTVAAQERAETEQKVYQGGSETTQASLGTGSMTIRFLVTESTGGLYYNLLTNHNDSNADHSCEVEYAPRDKATGTLVHTTTGGKLQSVTPVGGDAEAGGNTAECVISFSTLAPTIEA